MVENQAQNPQTEKVIALSASLLEPFQGHPFRVASGEEMEQLKESIREYGVLSPLLVRPRGDGRYEIVSGHRRKAACEALGITELPVLVRNMTDDEAVILMVDSNIQREHLSHLSVLLLPAGQAAYSNAQLPPASSCHAGGLPPLAEIEKQLHLLERHSLNTAEDVSAFTSEQEQKLTDLESRRTKCRNRLRRCRDPTECETLHTEKDELTKQITETRKELKIAQQIPSRVKRMRENIQLLNEREQQRTAHQKER